MIRYANGFFLLFAARQNTASVWGRFDHQRPTFGTSETVILIGVAALLTGALVWQVFTRRRQREFWCNSPSALFSELCRAHRLERSSRRLLKRLAGERGLKSPAALFVEPEHFDFASLPPNLKPAVGELRQLRHKLFD